MNAGPTWIPRRHRLLRASAMTAALLALLAGGGVYLWQGRTDPVRMAERLEAAGDLRAAWVELRAAVHAAPRDADLHLRLAELQMKLADPVAAEKEFRAARGLGAERSAVTLRLADALLAQAQYDETLRQVPPTGPTPAVTAKNLFMRAVAQLGLEDTAAAAASLAAARRAAPDAIEVALIAARVAAANGDYAETEAQVDSVLRRDPAQIDALLMKQQIVTARDDHAAALDLAARAVRSAPFSAMARIRHATELLYAKQDDAAQADVDAVLDLQPRFIEAVYLNAVLFARRGNYQDAAVELEKLDGVLGRFPQALYYKALVAANLGRVETAVDYARRYNTLVPGDPDGIKQVARSDIAARASAHAIPILERAAEAGLADAEMLDLLGSVYGNVGNTPAALNAFERAAAASPGDGTILTHLGLAQIQAGRVAAATGTLARSVEIAPAQPAPAEALVSAAIGEGDLDKASAALAVLRARAGESQAVGILSGMIEVRRQNLEAARAAFADTLRRFPASLAAKLDGARVLVLQGRRDEGMAIMDEVLGQDPGHVATLNSYLPLLMQDRQTDRAVAVLAAAHAADPRRAGFTAALADVLVLSEQPKRAVDMLAEVRSEGPLPPLLLASLARAQAQAGMIQDAKASFRAVLLVMPDDVVDRTGLIDVLLRDRDYDAARRELQEGLARAPGNFRFMSTLVELEAQTKGLDAGLLLAESLRAGPEHRPFATLLKGDALMRARRFNAAARAFLDEYAAAPDVPPLLRAAAALSASGQDEEAARLLRQWLKTAPNTPAVLADLAKLDLRANRLAEGQARLVALLAMLPDHPAALNNLAWTYQLRGDKRAREMAQRAYLKAPGPDSADTLGWILLGEGEAAAALPLLQQAGSARPSDPAVQYHWAAALRAGGRAAEAAPILQASLQSRQPFSERKEAERLLRELTPPPRQ